ncbi:MAG: TetR/AcrR family transcriptional regulator [Blautia sp.]|jgi:TetR/AcrR family transcriptional regulator
MEKFEQLPEEKKQRIINAALEVFAKNEYKNASTDLIAAKSSISKGLLFYYFKNKKSLYNYLVAYLIKSTEQHLMNEDFKKITDFYELLLYAGEQKVGMTKRNPFLMDFSVRAFYAEHQDVAEDINQTMKDQSRKMISYYFKDVRMDKFRDEVDPQEVINMLTWLADGYMHQKRMRNEMIDMEVMMNEYRKWIDMLRRVTYKEKYLPCSLDRNAACDKDTPS